MKYKVTLSILLTLFICTIIHHAHAAWSENSLLPGEKVVDLTTTDGMKISASFYYPTEYLYGNEKARAKKYPAVILIHSWLRDRSDWSPLAPYLQAAGYTVISIDLRNHGLSDGKNAWHKASFDYLTKMPYDARAAYNYICELPFVNTKSISLMGVSIGTIIASRLCAQINMSPQNAPIQSMVLVSPARNYFGVNCASAIEQSKGTPILFVLDKQDPSPSDDKIYISGMGLYRRFKGKKQLLEFDGVGHGNKMIKTDKFIKTTLQWLKETSQRP